MKFENTEVWGFKHALRGVRNPMSSWDKSDTLIYMEQDENKTFREVAKIGKNDLDLAQRLIKAGNEHRKFLRQIFVSVDITAPLYWWKEFDTYKVGTVANSTSTMHKLASSPITMDCFEMGDYDESVDIECTGDGLHFLSKDAWAQIIKVCENLRKTYNETKDKRYWKELIRLLPESWLQKRTVTMNYENILSMRHQRLHHKLTEWSVDFIKWVDGLPYSKELFTVNKL